MDWNSPTTEKHIAEAKAQGCELLGLGRRTKTQVYRLYRLPCGHERELQLGDMRAGNFRCQICFDDKLMKEAEVKGFRLLGPGKDARFRNYRLSCGHEQEIETGKIRGGGFGCKTCVKNKLTAVAEAQGCELIGAGKE